MSRELILILAFAAATLLGYKLINSVPSLLHTPLMSGMNALSGITILGAVAAVGLSVAAVRQQDVITGQILGGLAVVAATVNVVGGFGVTHRMLKMFDKKKKEERPS